jgi:hypothetical protein
MAVFKSSWHFLLHVWWTDPQISEAVSLDLAY